MIISFFEEFPDKSNLNKLKLINFPIKLYLASKSYKEFLNIKNKMNGIKKIINIDEKNKIVYDKMWYEKTKSIIAIIKQYIWDKIIFRADNKYYSINSWSSGYIYIWL